MEAGIPCAVPFGTACSHCLPGALRLSERDLTAYTTVRVPAQLRDLRVQPERRDTPSISGNRSARAGVTPAPRVGLRTPSPFPERPPSGRSAVPMYLGGEEILSNEYKDESDIGSSSGVHSPQFAPLFSESSRAHRAVLAAVAPGGSNPYVPYLSGKRFFVDGPGGTGKSFLMLDKLPGEVEGYRSLRLGVNVG
ncbi:hypothetical protein PC116_g40 [Phytophthora cactorum]|uniref:Uncharacterized protein n=1 Tax=Phytophthora cactorum TaxID=29920 RepID=A0A8T1EHF7_9STRA|nr:hypothetical protein PC117_g1566 [Phytophthora cactorum]KAG3036435.1 hypothetical protein PC120_g222 [Phytophthora cactorum]KAG3040983.1 hypothetical protein PC119_g1012 [Phytophthora cactorum]KAG3193537.1 hypothetical protein C6341_g42 [Phytophthora cactorum]KAG3206544.1 hypothetical protein PC128_g752 [Phytophthora cactorum]